MSFDPFQNFIQRAAGRYGIAVEMEASLVCQKFRSIVPEFFSHIEGAEDHIKPAFFKKGVLVIETNGPGFSQEVIMRKDQIIDEMNSKLGSEMVKNLRAQLRRSESGFFSGL
ncbi:DUF721 domain-containing protein [Candidatus Gracilibacteria bacterium]|nr:DUF721 domain-containing protein [Candidatus Gracilibacteria bacterium]